MLAAPAPVMAWAAVLLLLLLLLPSLVLAAPDAVVGACQLGPSTCLRDEQGPKACAATGGLCDRCLPYFAGGRFNAAVSRQGCACLCSRLGWTGIAGVENGNNCFCANASSPRTHCGQALPASACAVPCNGNRSATCGGNMAVEIFNFECNASCTTIPVGPPPPPHPKPPSPGPFQSTYPWPPTIHWAQGCLEGRVTHDISGGIIQSDGTYHTWIGCFNAQPGGGWQHVVSKDLLTWKLASPFTATALPPFTQGRHIEAGAVGIDDDGTAFAVEGYPTLKPGDSAGTGPYNAYRFTNSSNDAWEEPSKLFSFVSTRSLPGDPPRPWRDSRDNRW